MQLSNGCALLGGCDGVRDGLSDREDEAFSATGWSPVIVAPDGGAVHATLGREIGR